MLLTIALCQHADTHDGVESGLNIQVVHGEQGQEEGDDIQGTQGLTVGSCMIMEGERDADLCFRFFCCSISTTHHVQQLQLRLP